jgi:predicted signal transduction protein with EAL and GGDEF domain
MTAEDPEQQRSGVGQTAADLDERKTVNDRDGHAAGDIPIGDAELSAAKGGRAR